MRFGSRTVLATCLALMTHAVFALVAASSVTRAEPTEPVAFTIELAPPPPPTPNRAGGRPAPRQMPIPVYVNMPPFEATVAKPTVMTRVTTRVSIGRGQKRSVRPRHQGTYRAIASIVPTFPATPHSLASSPIPPLTQTGLLRRFVGRGRLGPKVPRTYMPVQFRPAANAIPAGRTVRPVRRTTWRRVEPTTWQGPHKGDLFVYTHRID